MNTESYQRRFAIAVSFPGEHRRFVKAVVKRLAETLDKERIFYDEWYQDELLGIDGDLKLKKYYRVESELVVPFFSKHYKKPWCGIEWHAIRAMLMERRTDDCVIPVEMDDTTIDGWEPTDFALKKKRQNAIQIADVILSAFNKRLNNEVNRTKVGTQLKEIDGQTEESLSLSSFRRTVKSLYEKLGYHIRSDIADTFADFYVARIDQGTGSDTFAVRCHLSTEQGELTGETIKNYAAYVTASKLTITRGILVVDVKTASVVDSIRTPGVLVTSLGALEEAFFGLRTLYSDYVNAYEADPIYKCFIPQRGKIGPKEIANVEDYLAQWIQSEESGAYIVLAEFGAGKTTLMQRLKYRASKMYLNKAISTKPVFFNLRDFRKSRSLDGLVRATLLREILQDVSLGLFWKAVDAGSILLLLDGFDEMSPVEDPEQRSKDMALLSRLLLSRSKAILTCRPTAFRNATSLHSVMENAGAVRLSVHSVYRTKSSRKRGAERRRRSEKLKMGSGKNIFLHGRTSGTCNVPIVNSTSTYSIRSK